MFFEHFVKLFGDSRTSPANGGFGRQDLQESLLPDRGGGRTSAGVTALSTKNPVAREQCDEDSLEAQA